MKWWFLDLFVFVDVEFVLILMIIVLFMIIDFGGLEVCLMYLGCGYIMGDFVVWVLLCGVLFVGGLVYFGVLFYCGDVYLVDWLWVFDCILVFCLIVFVFGYGWIVCGVGEVVIVVEMIRFFVIMFWDVVVVCVEGNVGFKDIYWVIGDVFVLEFGVFVDFEIYFFYNVVWVYDEVYGLD